MITARLWFLVKINYIIKLANGATKLCEKGGDLYDIYKACNCGAKHCADGTVSS